ncbi:MAG: hypothetical protein NZ750_11950 [Anaerolineae bacterium]|nr:hypothetical protein [Anaerolineae bacterium]MDW8173925.1 hypothetical protein [Anaerolineae bacterium]
MSAPKPHQPWTEEERAQLRQLIRYGLSIFAAVALTLVVVAVMSNVLGIQVVTLR